MGKRLFCVICLAVFFLLPETSLAAEREGKSFKGVEFLTGFGWSDLKSGNDYEIVPFIFDFDFDLKPLIGFKPKGLLQFQIEPFLSFISRPDPNIEVGSAFLIKFGILPEDWKLQPYVKGGVGMIYTSQHTREQATQFNFVEIVGAGLHYFFNKKTAFTLEGRFRHLSNAGIDSPNNGIDTYIINLGILRRF